MGNEQELRSSWVKFLIDTIPRWYNSRLGPTHDFNNAKFFKVVMKFADLIFVDKNEVFIVEFKVRKQAEAIGQLIVYKEEFGKTIEFKPYWDLKRNLFLVTNSDDEAVRQACLKNGIEYIVHDTVN